MENPSINFIIHFLHHDHKTLSFIPISSPPSHHRHHWNPSSLHLFSLCFPYFPRPCCQRESAPPPPISSFLSPPVFFILHTLSYFLSLILFLTPLTANVRYSPTHFIISPFHYPSLFLSVFLSFFHSVSFFILANGPPRPPSSIKWTPQPHFNFSLRD